MILAVSLYFCRQLESPSSCLRPTGDSTSQDLKKSSLTQCVTTTKIPTELQIYGFRKFLWNHFSLLFQAITVWGVSNNAFLISLVGRRTFVAPAVLFRLPETHFSLPVIFLLLILHIQAYSSLQIFLMNISMFKIPPLLSFFMSFSVRNLYVRHSFLSLLAMYMVEL